MRTRPVLCLLLLTGCAPSSPVPSGELVVFNAGSLAHPFRELLSAFARANPGVVPLQESTGSLEAARKLTELGKIPDVIGVADYGVISKLLMPQFTSWYATFATNAMVLAHTPRSAGAGMIDSTNWWQVLLRPDVRWGASNPALDPNGYRTLMVFQLAERHYAEPGLSRRLSDALLPRFIRPAEAQLVGLLQAGELDYAWSYRSLARTAGLQWVELPTAVNLSDPSQADGYGAASVWLPGPRHERADSVEFRGEPIVYALSIPAQAPHPETARAFVRFVFSPPGQEILRQAGFGLLPSPGVTGTGAPIP